MDASLASVFKEGVADYIRYLLKHHHLKTRSLNLGRWITFFIKKQGWSSFNLALDFFHWVDNWMSLETDSFCLLSKELIVSFKFCCLLSVKICFHSPRFFLFFFMGWISIEILIKVAVLYIRESILLVHFKVDDQELYILVSYFSCQNQSFDQFKVLTFKKYFSQDLFRNYFNSENNEIILDFNYLNYMLFFTGFVNY